MVVCITESKANIKHIWISLFANFHLSSATTTNTHTIREREREKKQTSDWKRILGLLTTVWYFMKNSFSCFAVYISPLYLAVCLFFIHSYRIRTHICTGHRQSTNNKTLPSIASHSFPSSIYLFLVRHSRNQFKYFKARATCINEHMSWRNWQERRTKKIIWNRKSVIKKMRSLKQRWKKYQTHTHTHSKWLISGKMTRKPSKT